PDAGWGLVRLGPPEGDMSLPRWTTGAAHNFGGLSAPHNAPDSARVVVLPVPYDFTTTYQSGTRLGPRAILTASENMELYDDEAGATYRAGIHTLPELEPTAAGPEAMCARVEDAAGWVWDRGRLFAMLGGEHSITAGAVHAAKARFRALSVLQI